MARDVTLAGSVTWIAGSDTETGTATLQAKGIGESRVELKLSGGRRTEIRNNSSGVPQGARTGTDGVRRSSAQHNCLTDPVWFFAGLSSLAAASNPKLVFVYVGPEQREGVSVQHLRLYQSLGSEPKTQNIIQRLSTLDFYLDPVSFLPLAITFKVHPVDDLTTDIPAEVRFANYQAVNGILVPLHIQRLVNGGLLFDVVVTTAQVNTGLSDVPFSIQ